MQVAKIVRSGSLLSIELPEGFDVGEGEMEITRQGMSILLKPLATVAPDVDEWAWLDRITGPWDSDFLAALEEEMPRQERPDLFK